jgi:hypothetical protein
MGYIRGIWGYMGYFSFFFSLFLSFFFVFLFKMGPMLEPCSLLFLVLCTSAILGGDGCGGFVKGQGHGQGQGQGQGHGPWALALAGSISMGFLCFFVWGPWAQGGRGMKLCFL